jgi:hypothetical protein
VPKDIEVIMKRVLHFPKRDLILNKLSKDEKPFTGMKNSVLERVLNFG